MGLLVEVQSHVFDKCWKLLTFSQDHILVCGEKLVVFVLVVFANENMLSGWVPAIVMNWILTCKISLTTTLFMLGMG